jgi:hypothetical protein
MLQRALAAARLARGGDAVCYGVAIVAVWMWVRRKRGRKEDDEDDPDLCS